MAAASSFVALRDDAGWRSLSTNEREFLRKCALGESGRVLRGDGRGPGEVRKVQLQLGRWHNGASSTVQWGKGTRVTSSVTATLLPPSPERPTEGTVSVSVDLSPMASTSFAQAAPLTTTPGAPSGALGNISDERQKLTSNKILRCLERTLLLGGALDTEALCVQSGAWVWRLDVSLTILDSGGNLLDASCLAAVSALRHYRTPQVDLVSTSTGTSPTLIHSDAREPTPLPLHHTPLCLTFCLVHADNAMGASTTQVAALVDPTDREECIQTGSISLAMNQHSEVCLLDFGGGCELTPQQLKQCWRLAEPTLLELCQMLETTLSDADRQAHEERLRRLQRAAGHDAMAPEQPLPPSVPFLQTSQEQDVDMRTEEWKDAAAEIETVAAAVEEEEAEEAYRLQALDYSMGHVAAKVKDARVPRDTSHSKSSSSSAKAGSLLKFMLSSAQGKGAGEPSPPQGEPMDVDKGAPKEAPRQETTTSQNPPKAAAPTTTHDRMADDDDDDSEEEATTLLQSEFSSSQGAATNSKDTSMGCTANVAQETTPKEEEEDDIDDLAMAIKKKKKKKKKMK